MTAIIAKNSTIDLYRWSVEDSDPAWENIAEVIGVRSLDFNRAAQDTTKGTYVFSTTADADNPYTTNIGGKIAGKMTLSLVFKWSTYNDFMHDMELENSNRYKIGIIDASNTGYLLRFSAVVTDLSFVAVIGNKVTADVSFKFSGKPIKQVHVTDVPDEEAEALLDFYYATNGDSWTNNSGWGTDPTVGNWYGITVSAGHVARIELANNNLVGTVQDELRQLADYLTHYTVNGNADLYGDLEDFYGFSALQFLKVDSTAYIGNLSDIKNITTLTHLYIGLTDIEGDISNLSSLTSLSTLYASKANLEGDLSNLPSSIQQLWLDWQQSGVITGDLSDLSSFSNLTSLKLNNCTQVTGSLSDLPDNDWVQLELYKCDIDGDIADICGSGQTSLQWLTLSTTDVSGDISNLTQHTNLVQVYASYTQLSGDVGDLHSLTSLTYLDLNGCIEVRYTSPSAGLPSAWDNCDFRLANMQLTEVEVNDFLEDMDAASTSSSKAIYIDGTNEPPTYSGEQHAISLENKGWRVYYNEPSTLKRMPGEDIRKGDTRKGE